MRKSKETQWNLYDPDADYGETERYLPHRDQPGALTFVTFRLGDSMPAEVIARWRGEIELWLEANGFAGESVDSVLGSKMVSKQQKRDLRRMKSRAWHKYLDGCYGKCCLRDPECRAEVCKSLLHFDGERYDVERYVVMPNHVHVMIQMRIGFGLRSQFTAIQRYSARKINNLIGRKGQLWQGEPFDHLIRSVRQFEYLKGYIADNPRKAGLSASDYTFYERM